VNITKKKKERKKKVERNFLRAKDKQKGKRQEETRSEEK